VSYNQGEADKKMEPVLEIGIIERQNPGWKDLWEGIV
jgi:hypothetical protein